MTTKSIITVALRGSGSLSLFSRAGRGSSTLRASSSREGRSFPPESFSRAEDLERRRQRSLFSSSPSTSTSETASTSPSPSSSSFTVDASAALRDKPTSELLRSYLVLRACQFRPLVSHGETILKATRSLPPLRSLVVDPLVRSTFFAQFCGGESEGELGPCVRRLRERGVGAILDYAAEPEETSSSSSSPSPPPRERERRHDDADAAEAAVSAAASAPLRAVARTHEYSDERSCDANASHVLRAIEAAAAEAGDASRASSSGAPPPPSSGFAAVKLTALTDPRVLVKLSACLRELDALFDSFDADADGRVTRSEFDLAYRRTFSDAGGDDERGRSDRLDELWRYLTRGKGDSGALSHVDRSTWRARIKLRDVPLIVPRCRSAGPLTAAAPTDEELGRFDNLMRRLRDLAAAARKRGVRLLVDAEYSSLQPAIDAAAVELMREFNDVAPTVYNTTQCYLRGAEQKLVEEIDSAKREGFAWAGKLVRGAYIDSENRRASEAGRRSPCWGSREETSACYDACVGIALERGVFGDETGRGEVLIATHNKDSVSKAIDLLTRLEQKEKEKSEKEKEKSEKEKKSDSPSSPSSPSSRVSFGQLMGMSESLTLAISRAGRRVYVYLPYGPLGEVLPYLLRRALENSQMLSGSPKGQPTELDYLREELKSRLLPWKKKETS